MLRKRIAADPRGYLLARLASVLRKQDKLAEANATFREAAEAFRKPADAGEPYHQDGLAWLLATCLDSEIRDGRTAVSYAEQAVTATRRSNALYLDTLAAAYAEFGDFTKAITVEKESIASNKDERLNQGMASRLKLYETGLPYRDNEYR